MNFVNGREWRNPNRVGWLYRAEESRFGCEQKGKGISDGDLVLCAVHSGDCFYTYALVKRSKEGLRADLGICVGSYAFTQVAAKLTDRQYHLLAAGETVRDVPCFEGAAKAHRFRRRPPSYGDLCSCGVYRRTFEDISESAYHYYARSLSGPWGLQEIPHESEAT